MYDTDTEVWEDIKSKSSHLLRSRFQMTYRIKRTPLTPFASAEAFHGEGGLQKMRYTVGSNISVAKQHNIKLYYRFQNVWDDDDEESNSHILGIGYTYKF